MAESVEPGLKPYQPNHRMTPPTAAMVMSWPGIGPPPSRTNLRPRRGPRTMAPARAIMPPMVCTTVEPAKSWNAAGCRLFSQPSGPQAQWPKIGYRKPETPIEYQRSPQKPVRPSMAPDVIVEQVSANANWNRKNASVATPVEPYVSGMLWRK